MPEEERRRLERGGCSWSSSPRPPLLPQADSSCWMRPRRSIQELGLLPALRHWHSRGGCDAEVHIAAQPQPGVRDERQRQLGNLDGVNLVPAGAEMKVSGDQHRLMCNPWHALTVGKPRKSMRSVQCTDNQCPEGGTRTAARRPQRKNQELFSKPLWQTAVLISRGDFCPRWQNAFCDDIRSAPAKHQREPVVQWQSLGKAEPRTHLMGSGEPRNRSGTLGAIRSCLRTASACGFETSATEIGQIFYEMLWSLWPVAQRWTD